MISTPEQNHRLKSLLAWGLGLLIVSVLFTLANHQVSRQEGRLSATSSYDDVVYLNKAARIYFLAQREGLCTAAHALFSSNLHAPFPVFNGLLGYALFGYDVESVYLMLALVVFTFLCFVASVCRPLPPILAASLVLSSLALPFASLCAIEFRPDLMWATVLSGTCVLWLCAERPFAGSSKSVLLGIALGFGLWIKPSTFAMTLLVMGGSWLLAAVRAVRTGRADWRRLAICASLSVGCAALVCGWYYVQHAGQIFHYFHKNSFGAHKEIWSYRGPWEDRWLYYLKGWALESNLGKLLFPLLLVYLGGCGHEILRGANSFCRQRGIAMLGMLIGLTVINGWFNVKSPYLGGSFYGFLIFGSLWYAFYFLGQGRSLWQGHRGRQWAAGLVILSGVWMVFKYPPVGKLYRPAAENQTLVNRRFLEVLSETKTGGEASVLFTHGSPVVLEYLEMELNARGIPMKAINAAFKKTLAEVVALLPQAEFVIVQDQRIVGSPGDAIPGEVWQPELKAYLDQQNSWSLFADCRLHEGTKVYLYRRNSGGRTGQVVPKN